ncbi:uncharacterized protein LOC116302701 [Actinia tenebrosa]|uniref:Uncharacterized protein LOC116302701 n=1 Tax=Actinia tenebrosa TaxID=6105 RepID=A0A6P8IM92_ACTTE|nr:uncharacterized protein LOC116302701 [Actinia tenebrosa]XP_031567917.1 uncharacterized protein LOC116302701 [Actinia tenebrosa]
MRPVILISLAAFLLASQVAVIIALVVLYKKFKTLKQEVHSFKIKKNRASLSALTLKEPNKNRPGNEYVDGQRHPSTLVRTNSGESIVYVPTPAPERRSKNFDDQENGCELNEAANVSSSYTQQQDGEVYGNQVVINMAENGVEANTTYNPSTPCIEDVNINSGYTPDTEEIYGNQVVIDMVSWSSVSNVQTSNVKTTDTNGTKSKKFKAKSASKKAMSQKCKTSIENERKNEDGNSFHEGNNTNVQNDEAIYENVRRQKRSSKA